MRGQGEPEKWRAFEACSGKHRARAQAPGAARESSAFSLYGGFAALAPFMVRCTRCERSVSGAPLCLGRWAPEVGTAVSAMDADDASPSRASRERGSLALPPQPVPQLGDIVPGCVAGCGSPTTGGVGPPGARPQHMCVPSMHSPHWGATNVTTSQPPLWSPPVLRGPPNPPLMVDARDTNRYESVRMHVREQHYMPFMCSSTRAGLSSAAGVHGA